MSEDPLAPARGVVLGVVFGVVLWLLILAVVPALARSVKTEVREQCEWPGLSYLDCITSGFAWVISGGPADDRLIGSEHNEIIHSGAGADIVNGKDGYDVCYVQPRDTVKGCEVSA